MKALDSLLFKIANTNYHTNVYGLVRSALAFSLLVTILFNHNDYMFPATFNYKVVNIYDNVNIFKLFGPQHLTLVLSICVIVLLWVISGFLPQVSAILHYIVAMSFFHSTVYMDGGDQISANLCLLLVPFCLTDKRMNHWQIIEKPHSIYSNIICYFFLGLICIQMSILYFHAAISKINVPDWLNGTACYYWFTHNTFGVSESFAPLFFHFLSNSFVVAAFTWGTILLETLLFAAIFMKQSHKNKLLVAGVIFHIGIWFIHGLFSFSIVMCAGLFIYLYPIQTFLFKKSK